MDKLPFLSNQHSFTQSEDNTFLTNPNQLPRRQIARPQPAVSKAEQMGMMELAEMTRKYEQLMTLFKNINVQEVTCQYREVSRRLKHLKIGVESQISKMSTIYDIDTKFLKKSWGNQPKIPFGYLLGQVQQMQEEQAKTQKSLDGLVRSVTRIEHEVG